MFVTCEGGLVVAAALNLVHFGHRVPAFWEFVAVDS
jgi:hypothetical protein